jgi:glycosyltransferase involved in cell wall biosynthesis
MESTIEYYGGGNLVKIAIEARPIKWSYGTGIGNYTYCLIEKLNEIDPVNNYSFLWADEHPKAMIPMRRPYTFYTLPKDDRREEIEIPAWLRQEQADLYHLPQNGFRIPRTTSCKLVVTVHDLIPYILPEMVRPSFLKRFIMEMPEIIALSDRIITVSNAAKQDIIKLFKVAPTKIAVVPSAPAAGYRPLPKEWVKAELRQKYQFRQPYILYVGGLNPRKNVAEIIYAYSKIHRELPDGQLLVILGAAGRHQQKLRALADSLDLAANVIFPGFVASPDLPLLYNGADLFVYPSLYEGFGLPPIEAMACGVPVIAANTASLPEVVGEAGLLVNPRDTLKLAETMRQVLTNPALAESLSHKGLQHCKKYTWENNAAQILQIYQNTVTGD